MATDISDLGVTSSLRGSVDYNQLMQDEMNKRLQAMTNEYMVSVAFSDMAVQVSGNKLAFMGSMYQAATDELVAMMRKEGYPDGSYKVQFLIMREPDGMTSKLLARAQADKRLKLWTPADADMVRESIAAAVREGMVNPTLPLPPEKLSDPLTVKRVRMIGDASMG